MDLWILAGQSNMVGRASLRGALTHHPNVWNFTSAGQWEIAADPLHRLWESFTPVHTEILRATTGFTEQQKHLPDAHWAEQERRTPMGAGLGISFGIAMTQAHGRPVGLIPCAHGGVSLEQWNPAHASKGAHSLFGAMLERIRQTHDYGKLKGILWYQGENDTLSLEDAASYRSRFIEWIRAARAGAGIADLPVILVQIGRMFETGQRYVGMDGVRQALAEIPLHVTNAAVTSSIDLEIFDSAHVTTSGLIRLGRRLARQALRLTEHADLPAGPHVLRIEPADGDRPGQPAIRVVIDGAVGRILPTEGIHGFSIDEVTPTSDISLTIWYAETMPGTETGTTIRLLPSHPLVPGMRIAYGQGLTPHCNVTDEADMPLCAFPPRLIAF
jgi:sialate O-acetylesterase